MDRTEFVHVVRLVATRTGVQEREHTGDEQRTLVVGHRVGTCKDSAGLAVHTLAVGEEEALACRIVLVKHRTLTHKALVHQRRVTDFHTRSEDEIDTLHTAAQMHRSRLVGVDRTVLESANAHQFGVVANTDILDAAAVEDAYVVADVAVIRCLCFGVRINLALQLMYHRRTMTIKRQHVRQAGTQFVEDRYLTSTALVHHRYAHAVTESRLAVHEDGIDVLDTGVVADVVVGDVVVDIVQVRLVAHFAVVQHGVVDTRVDLDAPRQLYLLAKHTQTVVAREIGMTHIARVKRLGHFHLCPVGCFATLLFQLRNLLRRQ